VPCFWCFGNDSRVVEEKCGLQKIFFANFQRFASTTGGEGQERELAESGSLDKTVVNWKY